LPVNDTANPLGQAGPTNPPGNFFTPTTSTTESFTFQQSGLSLPNNTPFGMTLVFDVTLTRGATLGTFNQSELALPQQAPPAPVPEPSTLALLALGGGVLAGWRRWRKRKATA
jgi:hypothetical protein